MGVVPGIDKAASLLSPDGVHDYVKTHYGERPAKAAAGLMVLTVLAICIAVLYTIGRGGYSIAKTALQGQPLPQVGSSGVMIGFLGLGLVLLALKVRRLSRGVAHIEWFLREDLGDRLERMDARTEGHLKRLQDLESHTDVSGLKKILAERFIQVTYGVEIKSARYGIGQTDAESIDVMEALELQKKDGRLDIVVNNETMGTGNIFQGHRKRLFVTYTEGKSELKTTEVEESHKLVLPLSPLW